VITQDEIETGCVETIVVDVKLRSLPDVPTLPSMTNVPPEVTIRNHVAVPEALALASVVIALNVKTPEEDAAAAVALRGSSARRVVAVPPDAGRVPS
jgi:hypothetical protein